MTNTLNQDYPICLINIFGLNISFEELELVLIMYFLSTGLRHELYSELVASIPHSRETMFSAPFELPA